jgi:hypothetical protein
MLKLTVGASVGQLVYDNPAAPTIIGLFTPEPMRQ